MSKILKLFKNSKYLSSKHIKYFKVYDELFSKYKNKKITLIEIGVQNGGSLDVWKKYFLNGSRIIGIDANPKCESLKKDGFEIIIGDQSDPVFWHSLFKKIGHVDIVIDDGGHTNYQQILTAICCVPKIKDNGILIIEDTHSSYLAKFKNPSKYSFINFVKKTIDDINFTFPGFNNFKFSLNKYIYAIEVLESLVIFKVNRKRCYTNSIMKNNGINYNYEDFRWQNKKYFFSKFLSFIKVKKYFK
jgi:hypothetical protein